MALTGTADRKSGEILRSESRLSYKLLSPTFIILILIAFYPLGSVFVTSFTNRTFAGGEKAEFIGFENYRRLLSFTIKELPPQVDEKTGEVVKDPETGKTVYERAVRILPREPFRYKELRQFSLFGKRYVIGAADRNFIRAVSDTVGFTVMSVFLETILGLAVALVLNYNFRGRGVMRAVMLIPWAIPTAVSSRIWAGLFTSNRPGFSNVLFQWLGWGDGQIYFMEDHTLYGTTAFGGAPAYAEGTLRGGQGGRGRPFETFFFHHTAAFKTDYHHSTGFPNP